MTHRYGPKVGFDMLSGLTDTGLRTFICSSLLVPGISDLLNCKH